MNISLKIGLFSVKNLTREERKKKKKHDSTDKRGWTNYSVIIFDLRENKHSFWVGNIY